VLWLVLGSRIVLVFDRCFPGPSSPKEHSFLAIRADAFTVGERGWIVERIQLFLDSQQRIVLGADGRSFTLGPVRKIWSDPVKPQYVFVPDDGDVVSFTRDVSRLEWHTPFAFSFMAIYVPKRHRYVYDRLRWAKSSGAVLEIVWRGEERFYPRPQPGWFEEYNNQLAELDIRPGPVEKAAAGYLMKTRKWTPDEYRLEAQAPTPKDYLITAIYLKDESASHPGGGKSVVLRISKSSKRVAGETGLQ
jgi:hypothetical protein